MNKYIKEIKAYTFPELTGEAKEKAKEWYLNDETLSWELTNNYESDLSCIFPNSDLKVQWSLSYCQGDGVKAKEAVMDFDLNNRDLETVEGAVSLTRRLALSKGKYSALAKTALMAVLVSGTFTDNGYRMPSTAAVVSNFKKVSKDMKRHTLSVFVDDPLDARADDNGYFTMPLF